jgi:hypothetical protein
MPKKREDELAKLLDEIAKTAITAARAERQPPMWSSRKRYGPASNLYTAGGCPVTKK